MTKLLCDIREAAAMLGVGRSTVYELMASHAIEGVKIGHRRLIKVASIEAYVETLERAA